ncbi:unnamed protein product [Coffea canephora]|uniref:PGG domain-containing protein n=1 Tax=Coffea canephora TaxID=49390 RepID=A0A068V2I9_COFCA|nr:unnamed protein product [Coffea canephora]
MDPELYKATIGGDLLEFVREMERLANDRHQCYLPASCVQLGPQKNTILHLATSYGHHEIVKLVCKDLPHLLAEKDARGDTALHLAARAGDTNLILLLTDSDYAVLALLGATNEEDNTPLHEALIHRHENAATTLIDKNRNMNYSVNHEGKSLMYLAAEAGYVAIISLLMDNPVGNYALDGKHKTKSPVHAAILGRNIARMVLLNFSLSDFYTLKSFVFSKYVLKLLWRKDRSSFYKRCEKGGNPLHCAAYIGFTDGISFLLKKSYILAYLRDRQGLLPIHMAASQGHVDIIQLMVQDRPDSREQLTLQGQNILHIAAKSGKCRALERMLKMPELEKLINEKDADGNTPLHVATIYGHPKVVSSLTWDERVILQLENKDGLTALDIAEEQMKPYMASFQKRLTWMALRVVGAPKAPHSKSATYVNLMLEEQPTTENYRDKVNVILLVATLVATVTFSAGFAMPGGYKNSDPSQGIANMLEKVKFQEFVICDSLAMYSSIAVAVMLLWAQLGDQKSMHVALKLALPLLGIALAMMSIAFTAGVYLVVSKLNWLAHFVLFMGLNFVIVLVLLFLPLCFLGSSNYHRFRFLSYCPFCLMLYALGSYAENEAAE